MNKDRQINLSNYSRDGYTSGASLFIKVSWYLINSLIFKSYFFPFSKFKSQLLKAFGAKVGKHINIKPNVNIKYPWLLELGDNIWLGEGVWIDNLAKVTISSNVCISQGAYLLTGSHNYKDISFGLIIKPITIKDGCWICARAIVCPGVEMEQNSIALTGAVITNNTEKNSIYQGNPAQKIRSRTFN